ncbi:MAG: hypothetical protein IT330_05175, partial [Anaerolineae bacterium]|nr:hypothetical protein [Anaerolineae bacterium]
MRSPVRGYLRRRLIPLAFGIALVLFVTVSSVPAHKAGAAIPPTDAQHMAAATAAITPTRKVRLPLLQSSYGFHLQTPNPRNIGITLAGSRAASATVPPPGGTLAATAADGTRFTLTLPADALLLTTTITMTPISGVTNLPQGVRFVAGVHLEPEGLRLYQLATLVITPTVAVPITREVPFASSALGQDVYMYPLDHKTRPVTFWLAHFSEFSLGDGGPIPVKPDLDSIPLLPEEQYMQELQTLVQNQRQAELLGVEGDPDYLKKMIALLRGYY